MNIEAKPWYPTFDNQYCSVVTTTDVAAAAASETHPPQTAAASASHQPFSSSRRHDPYASRSDRTTPVSHHEEGAVYHHLHHHHHPAAAAADPNNHNATGRFEGVYDYTTAMFGDEPLPEAAALPSYKDFVMVSGSPVASGAAAGAVHFPPPHHSQPYRSGGGGPYRSGGAVGSDSTMMQCASGEFESPPRHGSGCGVSACGSNESSGTPRAAATTAATQTAAKAAKEPAKPVAIPLPRSRRPAESPTSSTVSPLPTHITSPTSQQEVEMPKSTLSWSAMEDENEPTHATAAEVVSTPSQQQQTAAAGTSPTDAPPPTSMGMTEAQIAALNEETNLFIRNALMKMARANPAIQLHHHHHHQQQQHQQLSTPTSTASPTGGGAARAMPTPIVSQASSPVKPVVPKPIPTSAQSAAAPTITFKKEKLAPPAAPSIVPSTAAVPVAAAPAAAVVVEKKPLEKAKKKRKTEEEWHVVTGGGGSSSGNKGTTGKEHPAQPSTLSVSGFEALSKRRGKQKQQSPEAADSPSDEEEQTVIVVAPSTDGKKKKRKSNHNNGDSQDDDVLLEAASKQAATTVSRDNDEKLKQQQRVLHTSFTLFSCIALSAIPTYEALLPADYTPAHMQLLMAFFKARETDFDCHNARTFALERCATTVTSMAHSCPLLTCAIFAECCDSFGDVDSCNNHATRCVQLGKKFRLPICELIGQLSLCRLLLKIGEGIEARGVLMDTLKLCILLQEESAVGWVTLTIGSSTEMTGNLADTMFWYRLAAAASERTKDPNLRAHALSSLGMLAASVGHARFGQRLLQDAIASLESFPATAYQIQQAWQTISQGLTQLGDFEAALPYYAKEREWLQKDFHLSSTTAQNMVTLCRAMGNHAAAIPVLQELLQGDSNQREFDLLLSLATCYRDLKQTARAKEVYQRVLRGARHSRENAGQLIRSLVELADLSRQEGSISDALTRLLEAVRLQETLAVSERRQLCECEWRLLEVLEDTLIDRSPLDAMRCSDPTRYPNTADAEGLLRRRQYKSLPETLLRSKRGDAKVSTANKSNKKPAQESTVDELVEEMLDAKHFDRVLFREMLRDKGLGGGFDTMIVYSLRWNDGSHFYAYVVPAGASTAAEEGGCVHVRKLLLTAEVKSVLCTESALMQQLHPSQLQDGQEGAMIPYDTPLFPQRHMYDNFQLPRTNPELREKLESDMTLSLSSLYDCFVRPIEDLLPPAGSTLLFVGDGIVNCIPFHALFDRHTSRFLVQSYHSAKLPSVQHALTIYSRRRAAQQSATPPPCPSVAVNFVTAAAPADAARQALQDSLSAAFGASSVHVAEVSDPDTLLGGSSDPTAPAAPHPLCDPTVASPIHLTESLLLHGKDLLQRMMWAPSRNVTVSNTFFRAVHLDSDSSMPLLLDVGQICDLKEDFSGMLSTVSHRHQLATSAEVCATWDLGKFPLVACTRFGNFGSRAVHETSIPIYRALLLAGAQRLLLPCGNRARITSGTPQEVAFACDVLKRVLQSSGNDTVQALSEAMRAQLQSGVGIDDWAFTFALHGLP